MEAEPTKLDLGEVAAEMAAGYRQHRPLILRVTLLFAVFNGLANLAGGLGTAGAAVSIGLTVLISVAYGGMITVLLCSENLELPSAGDLWEALAPVLARVIWVTLIAALATFVGLVPLIVPGLVLLTLFAVAPQTVVIENRGILEAFGRSIELVRSNGLRVFLFLLLLGLTCLILILAAASAVFLVIGGGIPGMAASGFVQYLVVGPLLAIGPAVLYNQLARKPETGTTTA